MSEAQKSRQENQEEDQEGQASQEAGEESQEGGQKKETQGPLKGPGDPEAISGTRVSKAEAEAFLAQCREALNSEYGADDETHRKIMDFIVEHDIQPDLSGMQLSPERLAKNRTLADIAAMTALRSRQNTK